MRTAEQKVPKVCLAVTNQSKDEERSPTSHLSVHGFYPQTPCMDFAYWTTATHFPISTYAHVVEALLKRTANVSPIPTTRHVSTNKMRNAVQKPRSMSCNRQTMSKTKQNPTSHLSVQGPNMYTIPVARHVSFADATRFVQIHF